MGRRPRSASSAGSTSTCGTDHPQAVDHARRRPGTAPAAEPGTDWAPPRRVAAAAARRHAGALTRVAASTPAPTGAASRTPRRRPRDSRAPPGARATGGCGRSPGPGAAANVRPPVRRAAGKRVIAVLPRAATENRVRSRSSRPIGRSTVPPASGGRPSTTARYRLRTRRWANWRVNARCACGDLAKTMTPEVSLSSRCTTPGLAGSSGNASRSRSQWPSTPFRRVPVRFPAPGWVTTPGGLSSTMASPSSWRIDSSISSATAVNGSGSR